MNSDVANSTCSFPGAVVIAVGWRRSGSALATAASVTAAGAASAGGDGDGSCGGNGCGGGGCGVGAGGGDAVAAFAASFSSSRHAFAMSAGVGRGSLMRRRRKSASAFCASIPIRSPAFFALFTSAVIFPAIRAASLPIGSASTNGVSGRPRTSQISFPAALSLQSSPQGRGFALLSKRTAGRASRMILVTSRASSHVGAVVARPPPEVTTAPVSPENLIPALRSNSGSGT